MTLALQIIALIGLIVFVVFVLLHQIARPVRAGYWNGALIGLVVWAVATIILMLIALF